MVWDGLIFVLIVTLAVAGWNVGIINSWRGPFAMIISTLITQRFYVDAATYVVGQTRMPPEQAIAIAYLVIWCLLEVIIEPLLRVILPFGKKTKPMFFGRLFGAAFGIGRALLIILLPCIAIAGPIKVPIAPADRAHLIQPMESGIGGAVGVPFFV